MSPSSRLVAWYVEQLVPVDGLLKQVEVAL